MRISIVGGGSAGWMTATTFVKLFPEFDVTLIESPDIETIGVGESTLFNINRWLREVDIKYSDFLNHVDGTFKHSIKFTNFYKKDSGSFHYPFFQIPYLSYMGQALNPNIWWHKKNQVPSTPLSDYAESINPLALVSENSKFDDSMPFAYHFDATKFGIWLRDEVCKHHVKHIKSNVVGYNGDSITLENGKEIDADLFIDCTGFKSLLLDSEFISYSHLLPNDIALATRLPYKNKEKQMVPYTECTCINNGWVWQIPLRDKIGTGYVHSSKYINEDDAKQEFIDHLNSKGFDTSECEFRKVPMKIGRYKKTWVGNVVAIGLSAGFIEPLEGNGLLTVHDNLLSLVKILRRGNPSQFSKDLYNSDVEFIFEEWLDFVICHYSLSQREDTKYWKDNFERHYDLNKRSSLKSYGTEFFQTERYIYLDKGFHYIAAGMNFNPTLHSYGYNPDDVRKLGERKEQWKKMVKDIPTMLKYLSRHHRL